MGVFVRRILFAVYLFLISISCATADQVILPQACNNSGLHQQISKQYTYKIISDRSSRALKLCSRTRKRNCKTIEVHKFKIDCNGQHTDWATLVQQMAWPRKLKLYQSETRNYVLMLLSRGGRFYIDYHPNITARAELRVEIPKGYAPLVEVGAHIDRIGLFSQTSLKLISSARASEPKIVQQTRELPEVLPEDVLDKVARFASPQAHPVPPNDNSDAAEVKPPGLIKPQNPNLNDLGHRNNGVNVAAAGNMLPSKDTWSTTVIKEVSDRRSSTSKNTQQSMVVMILVMAIITSIASGIGWFATQRIMAVRAGHDPYQVILRRQFADLTRPDAQMCSELYITAQGLVEDIGVRAEEITSAGPLRRVLLREVRSMDQFIASTMKESPDDPKEWRRMRLRLQRVVTDLIRLKDIADSARRSMTSRDIPDELPSNKQEAYEILGANLEASEKSLKRLVDALRAMWHPDLATSDDDRDMRDQRIKQINVAWDLITGKRVEK